MSDRAEIYKSVIDINNKYSPRVMSIDYMSVSNPIVLDVGCACGDLGIALKNIKNATVYGFEYNKESIEIAKKTGAYEQIFQVDLDTLSQNDYPQFRTKFDYVVCGDILEHLRYPTQTLKILKTYLNNNGCLIASIPNIAHTSIKANLLVNDFTYTPLGLLDETHIHFFTYKSIAEMLSSIGLKFDECKWTLQSKQAWQPNNPYPMLSEDIKSFLFNDWHSFVCQYVVKSVCSEDKKETLLKHNLHKLEINKDNAPDNIKKYREQVLSELGETSEVKIANINSELQQKQQVIRDYENSKDKLNESLLEQKQQTDLYISNIRNLKKEIDIKNQQIMLLQNDVSSLKEVVYDKDFTINSISAVCRQKQDEISVLNTDIKILHQDVAGKNQEISNLQNENDVLQNGVAEKENKIKRLKNKLLKKRKKYKLIVAFLSVIILLLIWYVYIVG